MKGIEKLRDLRDEAASKMVDNPRWVCARAEEIADEIEREIAEKYMLLPVDADGVPIHVGDELECHANGYDGAFTVFAIGNDAVVGDHDIEWIGRNPSGWFHVASFCTHVKPRTVEDILALFLTAVGDDDPHYYDEQIAEYANELRELLGVSE